MATLKISDLSVGDYVCYCDRVYKVNSIEESGYVRANNESYSCPHILKHLDYIEPIPITAEILEKNGFVKNGGRWYNSEVIMEFEQYRDCWWRTINCGEYSVYFINYVHQLQHALRLAGVDKEINL